MLIEFESEKEPKFLGINVSVMKIAEKMRRDDDGYEDDVKRKMKMSVELMNNADMIERAIKCLWGERYLM